MHNSLLRSLLPSRTATGARPVDWSGLEWGRGARGGPSTSSATAGAGFACPPRSCARNPALVLRVLADDLGHPLARSELLNGRAIARAEAGEFSAGLNGTASETP